MPSEKVPSDDIRRNILHRYSREEEEKSLKNNAAQVRPVNRIEHTQENAELLADLKRVYDKVNDAIFKVATHQKLKPGQDVLSDLHDIIRMLDRMQGKT